MEDLMGMGIMDKVKDAFIVCRGLFGTEGSWAKDRGHRLEIE